MKNDRLNQVARRQRENSARDIAFGALMAVVVAIMLIAFTSTGRITPAQASVESEVQASSSLSDAAAQIQAHTERACGDFEPVPEPVC